MVPWRRRKEKQRKRAQFDTVWSFTRYTSWWWSLIFHHRIRTVYTVSAIKVLLLYSKIYKLNVKTNEHLLILRCIRCSCFRTVILIHLTISLGFCTGGAYVLLINYWSNSMMLTSIDTCFIRLRKRILL